MSCPNKNTPEWRFLENTLGVAGAYKVFVANGYEIPTGEKLDSFLKLLNPLYGLEYNQLDPLDNELYGNQINSYKEVNGVEPSLELKKAAEKLLENKKKVSLVNDKYVVNENGKTYTLNRATDVIKNQEDNYYAFEGNEEDFEQNRLWGNQIDFILTRVLAGQNPAFIYKDLEKYALDNNVNVFISEPVFNSLVQQFAGFKEKYAGSVILTQIPFYNLESGIAGTADIVIVSPQGKLTILDIKSSLYPTNYDPTSKKFLPYNKSGYENRYDKPFTKLGGEKKASKKETHAAQLSIYKGLAISQGLSFEDYNELGIIPINITETDGEYITSVKAEPQFFLDSNRNFIKVAFPTIEENIKDFSSYAKTNDLYDQILITLEKRLSYLERKNNSLAEKFIINRLKEKVATTEKAKALANFLDDIHQLFIGDENYKGALFFFDDYINKVKQGKSEDSNLDIISKLYSNKETIDMYRPIINEISGYLTKAKEIGVNIEPGSPLQKASNLAAAFNKIDFEYNQNINMLISKELVKSVSSTANMAHIKELEENRKIMATLDPESRAYKDRKAREAKLLDAAGEAGVTYDTLRVALEKGFNRDIPFVDYLLTPAISSSNPAVATFVKTYKKELENARQKSIMLSREAARFFNEYKKSSSASSDNPAAFNEPFYTTVAYYDYATKTMINRKAFVSPVDMDAYNKALNKMYAEAEKIENPTARNYFINKWFLENTEPIPLEDEVVYLPGTNKKVVIQKGRNTIIEEARDLLNRKIITQYQFDNFLKNSEIEIDGKIYSSKEFRMPSRSKYKSAKYEAIQKNPAQKRYYDFLIYSYFKSQERVPESAKKGYILPSVAKTNIDRLREQGILNYAEDKFENFKKFTERDIQQFGEIVEGMKVIPVLYSNNMPAEDVSLDLISSVLLFDESSLQYEAASKVETLGLATLESLKTNKPLKTDAKQNKIISEAAKKAGILSWEKYLKKHNDNNIAALLEAFIDMQIYGIKMIDAKQEVFGKVVDLNKIANNLMGFSAFTQIGANPIGSAANSLQANAQILIEAAAGDFFDTKELAWAKATYAAHLGDYVKDFTQPTAKSLIGQLTELYDPMQGEYRDQYGRKISMSALKKAWSTNTWFFLQNQGEHAIQVQALLAMLKRKKVTRIVNGKKEEISLYDAYELGSDGNIKLKSGVKLEGNLTENGLVDIDLQNSLHAINKRMHGVYNNFDKIVLEREWWGRLLIMYRKFFVPGLKRRYKSYGLDQELGLPTEGYYNTFFRLLIKQTKEMFAELSPFNTESKLTPLEKKNLARASREMGVILSTGVLVMLLNSLYEAADDDEKKLYAYPLLFAMRLNQETVGFLNPLMQYKVLKNPMAVQSTIEKVIKLFHQLASNPLEEYERPSGLYKKGDLKIERLILRLLGLNKNVLTPEETIKAMEKNF